METYRIEISLILKETRKEKYYGHNFFVNDVIKSNMHFLTVINLVKEHWLINTRIEGGPQGRSGRPWGPLSLPYNGTVSFPGVKRSGSAVDHPPPSSSEVKERVDLYICSSPRGFIAFSRVKTYRR
jgi:hypothetical protein